MKRILVFAVILQISLQIQAQLPGVQVLESGKKVSIRGLSVVNNQTVWASGSNGSVAKTTDGGKTWIWLTVPAYEKRDFRDIEAFDANTAVIMAVSEPAVILKTKDGGLTWKKVLEDSTKGMFLDAMHFADAKHGAVVGDPVNGHMYLAITSDGGESWQSSDKLTMHAKDEAFFASSGTNLFMTKNGNLLIASGGKEANLYNYHVALVDPIPIVKGATPTGANSIDYQEKKKKGIIAGGDFTKDTIIRNNCALFSLENGKPVFTIPETPPHGYRSCVIYLDEDTLLTCGTSGTDISKDGGKNWELISKESFHVCQKAKKGKAIFLAGANGRIARLINP